MLYKRLYDSQNRLIIKAPLGIDFSKVGLELIKFMVFERNDLVDFYDTSEVLSSKVNDKKTMLICTIFS